MAPTLFQTLFKRTIDMKTLASAARTLNGRIKGYDAAERDFARRAGRQLPVGNAISACPHAEPE
jgi:hypothetical protein